MDAFTDKEILAAAAEEFKDPKAEANEIRVLLLREATARGKKRLQNAQAEIAEEDAKTGGSAVILSFADKKAKLARLTEEAMQVDYGRR